MHRTRSPDGRTNRQADRRERYLAQHSGVPRRNGRRLSAWLVRAGQGIGGVRRYGQNLRAGEEVQDQTAFGTDIVFSESLAQRQGELLAKWTRWYTAAETLVMATETNAELLALSGKRNPYPGKLGVVEEGALADLLLVDGDPITDIKLIEDPKHLLVIMKDGMIYKNALRK